MTSDWLVAAEQLALDPSMKSTATVEQMALIGIGIELRRIADALVDQAGRGLAQIEADELGRLG